MEIASKIFVVYWIVVMVGYTIGIVDEKLRDDERYHRIVYAGALVGILLSLAFISYGILSS